MMMLLSRDMHGHASAAS